MRLNYWVFIFKDELVLSLLSQKSRALQIRIFVRAYAHRCIYCVQDDLDKGVCMEQSGTNAFGCLLNIDYMSTKQILTLNRFSTLRKSRFFTWLVTSSLRKTRAHIELVRIMFTFPQYDNLAHRSMVFHKTPNMENALINLPWKTNSKQCLVHFKLQSNINK